MHILPECDGSFPGWELTLWLVASRRGCENVSRLIAAAREIDQGAPAGGSGLGLMNNLNVGDDSALVSPFTALET